MPMCLQACSVALLAICVTGFASQPCLARTPQEAEEVARRVLGDALVIDTHVDTPQMMLEQEYDLADPASPYMVSIPKMRAGHVGAIFFSIWVRVDWPKATLLRRTLDLIDVVHEQVEQHRDALALASTAGDIRRLQQQGKISVLLGLEGGHMIENDLRLLSIYYRLGVRYMTLTHSAPTDWADSSSGKPRWNGLTGLGRRIIEQMNHLGMMVDVSHVSDKTFYDALATTKAPVIASHSSCRALVNHPRNMSDEMLRALAKNGGVVHINFYPTFIDEAYLKAHRGIEKKARAAIRAARQRAAREGRRLSLKEEQDVWKQYQVGLPAPDFRRIADHIDHAVRVAGIDHVGLGSDFDGIDATPRGMEDISRLPDLVRELARRGHGEEALKKILGENLLRVMRRVEDVAGQIQAGK